MGCDAVVTKKVIGVAMITILSIELTTAFALC